MVRVQDSGFDAYPEILSPEPRTLNPGGTKKELQTCAHVAQKSRCQTLTP